MVEHKFQTSSPQHQTSANITTETSSLPVVAFCWPLGILSCSSSFSQSSVLGEHIGQIQGSVASSFLKFPFQFPTLLSSAVQEDCYSLPSLWHVSSGCSAEILISLLCWSPASWFCLSLVTFQCISTVCISLIQMLLPLLESRL